MEGYNVEAIMEGTPNENDEIKNHPTANLTANKRAIEELTDAEKQILNELRNCYIESTEIEIEQHKSIFNIEVAIDEACKDIFKQRRELLQQFDKPPLKHFWLCVFKSAGIALNTEDEKCLEHLIDVRSRMETEPKVKMVIDLEFEKNPYFSNELLTKTYYIKCHADPRNAILYDGIEITSTEGTKINWLTEKNYKNEKNIQNSVEHQYSFFEFFNNHSENENVNRALLSEEIAFGFFLREKVIPKAIYFFTGEIRTDLREWSSEDCAYNEYDEDEADYDGDSEADSDVEETHQYIEFENEMDSKEQLELEAHKKCVNTSSSEGEHENEPLIDTTGDES